jgi:hypothetical protein
MQSLAHSLSRRLFKPLAFSLALFSLFLLLGVIPHAHPNNQENATCTICQIGRVGITPAVSTVTLSAPLVNLGQIVPDEILISAQTFSSHSPSRAPPSTFA